MASGRTSLNSAAVKNYPGPVFYPIDMQYRVVAKWEPGDGKKTVDVPNVLGDMTPVKIAGTVVFQLNGQEFRSSQTLVEAPIRACLLCLMI